MKNDPQRSFDSFQQWIPKNSKATLWKIFGSGRPLCPYSAHFYQKFYSRTGAYGEAIRRVGPTKIASKLPDTFLTQIGTILFWEQNPQNCTILESYPPELSFSTALKNPSPLKTIFAKKKWLSLKQIEEESIAFTKQWELISVDAHPKNSILSLAQQLQQQEQFLLQQFGPFFLELNFHLAELWQQIREKTLRFFEGEKATTLQFCLLTPSTKGVMSELLESLKKQQAFWWKKFGHRGFQEEEFAAPKWLESTSFPQNVVPKNLTNETWISLEQEISFMIGGESFLEEIEEFQHYKRLQESTKDEWQRIIYLQRLLLLELKAQTETDVFYLTSEEIQQLCQEEKQNLSLEKRYQTYQQAPQKLPLRLYTKDKLSAKEVILFENNLTGTGISPGIASGEIVLLTTIPPKDLTFCVKRLKNKIVVLEIFEFGWIPYLLGVKGIIVSQGGLLSEAGDFARSNGIPSVVDIPLQMLQEGQQIELNGNTGEIKLLPKDSES